MPVTLFYKPGKAPDAKEREGKEIVLFLERELNAISLAFTDSYLLKLRELHVAPDRPRDGMVVYADGSNWDPGDGEGIYAYVGGVWVSAGVAAGAAAADPAFSAHKNGTDQTGVISSVATKLTFSTEVWDIGDYFASSRWTPPAGSVHLTAALYETGTITAGTTGAVYIYKNGTLYKQSAGASLTNAYLGQVDCYDRANGTDYYEMWGYGTTTAGTITFMGQTTATFFQGVWLGP